MLEQDKKRYSYQSGGMLGDLDKDGKLSGYEKNRQEAIEKNMRKPKQEGGSIDDQMKLALEITPMSSDEDMEDNYTDFIIGEALTEEEESMLMSKLQQDEELQNIFDKVIEVAQEFAGSGPVEGPGSGVSDSIPARLSDGEFVFTAKAVEEIGEDTLLSMMKEAEASADKRQNVNVGGMLIDDRKQEVDRRGMPVDEDNVVQGEIRKGMLSANPRLNMR
jgi:hypothetical protein